MRFQVGDRASFTKTISEADVVLFAGVSGDTNPLHLDAEYARKTRFGARIAHGILTAGLISTVIGTRLPGTGAVYLAQSLKFLKPVYLGDTVTATAYVRQVRDRDDGSQVLTLETVCVNQRGERVLEGEAKVLFQPIEERRGEE